MSSLSKASLIELIRRARSDEQAFIDGLSPEERAETGTLQRWSAKDLIAHMTFWRQWEVQRIALARRGEKQEPIADYNVVNDAEFERNRDRSWSEVLADWESGFEGTERGVSQVSEEALADRNPPFGRDDRSLLELVAGHSFHHPQWHLAEYYLQRGQPQRAVQVAESTEAAYIAFDDSERARGTALYNLGCIYALTGDAPRALEQLREALRLRPDLIEWSKEDSDLSSLRDLPEFQALYANAPSPEQA